MLASQQVIARVVQLLVAAATGAGARVYSDRFHPIDTYPAVKVVHVDEDLQAADDDITWPAVRLHRLQLDVMGFVQVPTGLDAALAALAEQILLGLEATQATTTLNPLAGCQLTATGIRYQAQAEGEASTGITTVRLEVLFHTASNNPSTFI